MVLATTEIFSILSTTDATCGEHFQPFAKSALIKCFACSKRCAAFGRRTLLGDVWRTANGWLRRYFMDDSFGVSGSFNRGSSSWSCRAETRNEYPVCPVRNFRSSCVFLYAEVCLNTNINLIQSDPCLRDWWFQRLGNLDVVHIPVFHSGRFPDCVRVHLWDLPYDSAGSGSGLWQWHSEAGFPVDTFRRSGLAQTEHRRCHGDILCNRVGSCGGCLVPSSWDQRQRNEGWSKPHAYFICLSLT